MGNFRIKLGGGKEFLGCAVFFFGDFLYRWRCWTVGVRFVFFLFVYVSRELGVLAG